LMQNTPHLSYPTPPSISETSRLPPTFLAIPQDISLIQCCM
jgi:hypothetical protein